MIGIIARIVGTGLALWITTLVYKQISFGPNPKLVDILIIAAIFGLVNAFLKPILKLFSLPLRMMTLGLFGFVINGVLLLLLAAIAEQAGLRFTVGGYPPHFGVDAILAAIVGAIVLSVVSMVVGWLPFVKTSR